ncbi:aminoglycoside phosphotransferase family protein [Actinopolymorpha pittospori]|uniref:Aminoglycoside phosphotransferase domain-containing protein n=1 Tax=Actinopolymorpha pittospori TaxID=648752 RepID=A0A927MWM8_9ACTN|nr:aminoglycoside phosphotransferase family protein [Actinopolymorpha pittospori]MBE1608285.1 hypothetical protein [Actinopolymorpha pittospori]
MRQERFDGAREGREICRVGDTVRRPSGPWTPAVHALLRYLESVGFEGAPRVLGVDDEGREVLRFVAGQDGRRVPDPWASLRAVGELIRRFHDAVRGFEPPPDALWRRPGSDGSSRAGPTIICHNDLAPYNTIYEDSRPTTLIDWDLAGPGSALTDAAHAAWSFVPLYTDEDCARIGLPVAARGPRLREFCDGYGLQDRDVFLDAVRTHLRTSQSSFARRSIPFLEKHRAEWEQHLL